MRYKGIEIQITQSGCRVYVDKGKYIEFPNEQEAKEWIDDNNED